MFKKFIPLLLLFILSCTNKDNSMNPFLNEYETPFKIPPFEEIEFAHYEPAFDIGMKEHLIEIEEIANSQQEPTFENTIEAMERSGETLDKVANVFFNLLLNLLCADRNERHAKYKNLSKSISLSPLVVCIYGEYDNNLFFNSIKAFFSSF